MSRVPLERFVWIAAQLREGRVLNSRIGADRFEVSPKTLWRDLKFMSDRLGYQIEWNAARQSYEGQPPEERIL